MVFSSLTFLYLFLPSVLILYFVIPNRIWRNTVLLAASFLFYAWGEPKLVLVMACVCLLSWISGMLIEQLSSRPGPRKAVFILTVAVLLGNLILFKYTGFLLDNLRLLFPNVPAVSIALPIGISFYTFQILSYIIDLYRGRVAVQRSPFRLALYVSLFPQLIAGPIVRYQTVEAEITTRKETLTDVSAGLCRFALGLGKKVILANNLAAIAELIYSGNTALYGTAMYWIAAIAFTLEIYFDFSGYSDMAIGLGRVFGFHFLENFEHPYLALSITDFWRRWHISLSSWFRDYVYIPLGGNRVSTGRWVFNLLLVWGLTGLWHGAMWNFLLWGLYYGLFLLAEKLFLHRFTEKLPTLLRWMLTMLVVTIGWVLFNLTDFTQLREALSIMFTLHRTDWTDMLAADTRLIRALLFLPLGIMCSFPLLNLAGKVPVLRSTVVRNIAALTLLVVSIAMLISTSFNPFIYFRF